MKIVVLDGQTLNPGDNPWTPIRDVLAEGDEFVVYEKTSAEDTLARATGAEILLTNKTPLNAATLNALPELRLICVLATGVNTVDLAAAKSNEVIVCNVPEYGTDSVAQFVMAQVLYHAHRVGFHDTRIREGAWAKYDAFSFWETPQVELAGLQFGIFGYGRIGKAVAKLAQAFGMNVLVHSRSHIDDQASVKSCTFDELLSQSDILSLHCVLNEETKGIMDAVAFSKMKPNAILINTARGSLVNESALANALENQRIGGAALDVVPEEPISENSPLLEAPNLLLTPHMAWSSVQARRRLMDTTALNIRSYQQGSPRHRVA